MQLTSATIVATLLYQDRMTGAFRDLVLDFDDLLRDRARDSYLHFRPYDDFAIFEIDGARVAIAVSDDIGESEGVAARHQSALVLGVAFAVSAGAPHELAVRRQEVSRMILDRVIARYPTQTVLWSEIGGEFGPDEFDMILREASLARDGREWEAAASADDDTADTLPVLTAPQTLPDPSHTPPRDADAWDEEARAEAATAHPEDVWIDDPAPAALPACPAIPAAPVQIPAGSSALPPHPAEIPVADSATVALNSAETDAELAADGWKANPDDVDASAAVTEDRSEMIAEVSDAKDHAEADGGRAPTSARTASERYAAFAEIVDQRELTRGGGTVPKAAPKPAAKPAATAAANALPDIPSPLTAEASRIRKALYGDETRPNYSTVQRVTIYTLNTSLIIVAAPIGGALLTYNALGRESMQVTARATALTGFAFALFQSGMGHALLNMV